MTLLTRALSLFMPRLAQSLARDLGFIDVVERRAARRAPSTADRPLVARRISVRHYRRMSEAFADLSIRAADANPHMSPASMAAAADTLHAARDIVVIAAFDPGDDDMPEQLMGVWLLRQGQEGWALGARTLTAPLVPQYDVQSAPVLDGQRAQEAMQVMLRAIAADETLPRLIYLPSLPLDGITAAAVKAALHARIARMDAFETWHRAVMLAGLDADGEAHVQRAIPTSRKRRSRQLKAMNREGAVTFRLKPANDAEAFTTFLALEARSWKGAAGTALCALPQDAEYFRALLDEHAAENQSAIAELTCGDTVIASGLLVASAGVWHFMKSAFDPALAKHSPGVLLNIEVSRALHGTAGFRLLDSGMDDSGDADSQVWADRRAMGRALIDLGNSQKARLPAEMLAVRRSLRALKNRA